MDGSTLAVNDVRANKVTLKNGGLLTHWCTSTSLVYKLELNVTANLFLDTTSKIDVSSRGYLGAYSSGNNSYVGRTNGNTTTGGSSNSSGGSYGGYGGYYSGAVAAVYGDPLNPNEPGSGAGSDASSWPGGNGGGLARIKAGSIQLDGTILADGQTGNYNGGGGSGGGIRIDAGMLSGAGFIYARGGGSSGYNRGGGGGGRIAINYGMMTLPQGNVVVSGAATSHPGYAGTVRFTLLP